MSSRIVRAASVVHPRGGLLLTFQAILIGFLVLQIGHRRRSGHMLRAHDAALRRSHERISDLAGRLITAQEAERARIARDLHDDVCQDVAAVSVEIGRLRQNGENVQSGEVQDVLLSLQRRTAGVAESLRLLSHGLHSSVLQHVGLVAALQGHCAEVERQHRFQVRFLAEGDVEPARPLVALSLFRIAQEALRNAARHGHPRHATVSLTRDRADLRLAVADDGGGFDPGATGQNRGLGLVSIEERARLVHGRTSIRSQPGRGTTVIVHVPGHVSRGTDEPVSQ